MPRRHYSILYSRQCFHLKKKRSSFFEKIERGKTLKKKKKKTAHIAFSQHEI